jgi:hypothetical protein
MNVDGADAEILPWPAKNRLRANVEIPILGGSALKPEPLPPPSVQRLPGPWVTGHHLAKLVRSLLCALALAVALAGCGGDDSATISGCGAGRGSPITAEKVLAAFNAAGYELSRDDCFVTREVAFLDNGGADDAEARVGHVLCSVDATVPPGRGPGVSPDSAGTSGFDAGIANVTCTLHPRGNTQDEVRQVAKLRETIAALAPN